MLAGLIGAGCLALLVTAFALEPSGEGHGTHTQLGLPACAWAKTTGVPCMTCGMTTSFAHAARADFPGSARSQPFATALALAVAAGVWAGLHVALTGSRLGSVYGRLLRPRWLMIGAGLLIAAWVYKIAVWPA